MAGRCVTCPEWLRGTILLKTGVVSDDRCDCGWPSGIERGALSDAEESGRCHTAEGVETEDQLAQVMALGCDNAQGFYFSRPLEAESATKLIATDRRWEQAAA